MKPLMCWGPTTFQPTRPLRGATTAPSGARRSCLLFQPTRPLRGATHQPAGESGAADISTHAPLAGRDRGALHVRGDGRDFNPRAPCGARLEAVAPVGFVGIISTHAPLAGRDPAARRPCAVRCISTHAPLAGRDDARAPSAAKQIRISTHAPLAGRDPEQVEVVELFPAFQPTRPLRGATVRKSSRDRMKRFQPTRPLRGATPADQQGICLY